jgi:hypothetical protein
MPGKNKPKRLDRNRAWRVARRKKRIAKLVSGGSRNRKPRPKNKGKIIVEKAKEVLSKIAKPAQKVEKKVIKKAVKKVAKKKE